MVVFNWFYLISGKIVMVRVYSLGVAPMSGAK